MNVGVIEPQMSGLPLAPTDTTWIGRLATVAAVASRAVAGSDGALLIYRWCCGATPEPSHSALSDDRQGTQYEPAKLDHTAHLTGGFNCV